MAVRDPLFQAYVRRLHLAGGLITLAVLTALYTVADGHLDQTARNLEAERSRNQMVVLQQPAVEERITELRSEITSIESQLIARRLRIPEYPAEHEFSEHLNVLAGASELTIEELRPDQFFHSASMDRMTFRVRVAGGWQGLCTFLRQITSLERLCHIDQCRLTSDQETQTRLRCDLQLSIFTRAASPTATLEKGTL